MDDTTPHPDVQAVLDDLVAESVPPLGTLSVEGARALHEDLFTPPAEPIPVDTVRDLSIDGPNGPIPIRVYAPHGDGPFPVLVYYHGGGWVVGDLDSIDPTCRALTNVADAVVVSVDYRLAPEHPFPEPIEDCYAALSWVAANTTAIRGDPERVAVGGDSAGGNLAAAVALLARDRGGPSLVHQALVYPVTEHAFETASYEENAEGYFLTRGDMEWFWNRYLPTDIAGRNPYASPLCAPSLADLPSASVVTAGFDPLRDEGVAYADALDEAGVDVAHHHYPGMIHGFFTMLSDPDLDQALDAVDAITADLREAFDAD